MMVPGPVETDNSVEKPEYPNVSEIIKDHEAVVVHGISEKTPVGHSLLNPGVGWKEKLQILVAFEPTISTSTVKKNDSFRNIWSSTGVILCEGEVEDAYSVDAGTVAQSLSKREGGYDVPEKDTIEQVITRSGNMIGQTGREYNELVVSNPSCAGIYICIDDEDNSRRLNPEVIEDILETSQEWNFPVSVMYRGNLITPPSKFLESLSYFKIEMLKKRISSEGLDFLYSEGWEDLDLNNLNPVNVFNNPEEKEKLKKELLEAHVFNLIELRYKIPEISNVLSYQRGLQLAYEIIQQDEISQALNLEKGEKPISIGQVSVGDFDFNYKLSYAEDRPRVIVKETDNIRKIKHEEVELKIMSTNTGIGECTNLGIKVKDYEYSSDRIEYVFEQAKRAIEYWKESFQRNVENNTDPYYPRDALNRITYLLYGFGVKAKELLDREDIYAEALSISSSMIPDIGQNVSKRIDENGKLVLFESDLE